MSGFDEENDGADRCSVFVDALVDLLREHRVKIVGAFMDLQQCKIEHDDPDREDGWILDLQDIQSLMELDTKPAEVKPDPARKAIEEIAESMGIDHLGLDSQDIVDEIIRENQKAVQK